ncbi:MAG: hypothetical protein K8R21_03870, partial [Leptospira sp.]|nr:hypothetical protein [Leptospira sp.]
MSGYGKHRKLYSKPASKVITLLFVTFIQTEIIAKPEVLLNPLLFHSEMTDSSAGMFLNQRKANTISNPDIGLWLKPEFYHRDRFSIFPQVNFERYSQSIERTNLFFPESPASGQSFRYSYYLGGGVRYSAFLFSFGIEKNETIYRVLSLETKLYDT